MRAPVLALAVLAGAALPLAAAAQTAAAASPYVVEGPGRTGCADLAAQEPGTEARRLTAAWLTGYLTAHHRLMPEVFDLSAWQSPALMLALVDQYCAAHPDAFVERAAQELVAYLLPRALTEPAEVVSVEHDGRMTLLYLPVLAQIAERLTAEGHPPAGPGPADLPPALLAYQAAAGLDPTGLPDQDTLARLLR